MKVIKISDLRKAYLVTSLKICELILRFPDSNLLLVLLFSELVTCVLNLGQSTPSFRIPGRIQTVPRHCLYEWTIAFALASDRAITQKF